MPVNNPIFRRVYGDFQFTSKMFDDEPVLDTYKKVQLEEKMFVRSVHISKQDLLMHADQAGAMRYLMDKLKEAGFDLALPMEREEDHFTQSYIYRQTLTTHVEPSQAVEVGDLKVFDLGKNVDKFSPFKATGLSIVPEDAILSGNILDTQWATNTTFASPNTSTTNGAPSIREAIAQAVELAKANTGLDKHIAELSERAGQAVRKRIEQEIELGELHRAEIELSRPPKSQSTGETENTLMRIPKRRMSFEP